MTAETALVSTICRRQRAVAKGDQIDRIYFNYTTLTEL